MLSLVFVVCCLGNDLCEDLVAHSGRSFRVIVCCLGNDLCEDLITHSGGSFRVIVSNCVGSAGVLVSP